MKTMHGPKGGGGGGETPATALGRLKAPARKQVTPVSSSPPSTSPGQLLDDERRRRREAAAARVRVSGGLRARAHGRRGMFG
jgi:hypothetical protein